MKNEQTHRAVLLLGSNLGDRFLHLESALEAIAKRAGHVEKTSSVFETQPWGVTDQPNYLNAAIIIHTKLSPQDLLNELKTIEQLEGRTERKKYASRTLDIDILFYDDFVLNSKELSIPHPKLHLRKFALVPLIEIDPEQWHPVLNKTVKQLGEESTDALDVKLYHPASH
jgi:2-amino-4-hydroxy-6-hydroxymethyldihydropteridine diphosphokinase